MDARMSKRQRANNQVEPTRLEDVESTALEQETGNLADICESRPKERSSAFPKIPESLAEHLEKTSLHGARFLIEGHIMRRLLWLGAMCVSLAYCTYQLRESLLVYFDSPFVTQITMKDDYDTPFPAVTLCNFNAINKRMYKMQRNGNITDAVADQEIATLAQIRLSTRDTSRNIQVSEGLEEFKYNTSSGSFADGHRRLSHKIEEMLLPEDLGSCTLNGVRCNASNFTSFLNFPYSQCYTINSGKDGLPINSAQLGAQDGLKLLLNVERDSYTASSHNPMVGLKVLVHHQTIFPGAVVEDLGFAVEPGKHSFCSMKKKEIVNLPMPHTTNCSNRRLNFFNINSNYSKEACLKECKYREAMKKCKCQPASVLRNEYPACSTNERIFCFVSTKYEVLPIDSCRKNCPEPCHYFQYETRVTNAALLEDHIAKDLLASLKKQESYSLTDIYRKLLNSTTPAERTEYVRRNIVYLTIYFEELRYQRIEQVPSFGVSQLLTALGGNLGLFLGVSMLTILEFVDFVVRRLLYFVLGKLKKPLDHNPSRT